MTAIFFDRLQLVKLVFAEAFDAEIISAQEKSEKKEKAEKKNKRSALGEVKAAGKFFRVNAGGCWRKYLRRQSLYLRLSGQFPSVRTDFEAYLIAKCRVKIVQIVFTIVLLF